MAFVRCLHEELMSAGVECHDNVVRCRPYVADLVCADDARGSGGGADGGDCGGGAGGGELACSILPRGRSAGTGGFNGSADGGLPGAACVAHTARSLRNSHSRVVAFGMQRLPACEGSLCAYASRQAV
eukprot:4770044-Prymnesium_polylepis.1